jgi:ABC-type transporter lipoprotein component MlaA
MAITDKQRMDFLERQHWTRWVGADVGPGHHVVCPVFGGESFREKLDHYIRQYDKTAVLPDFELPI